MQNKTMLIINPVSGTGKIKSHLFNILNSLSKGGNIVSVFFTEKSGDATEFAAEYGPNFDRLICSGGDGTLNEVMSGLMRLPAEKRPTVGYIPLGTTNDMASTLQLPKTTSAVISHIEAGNTVEFDVGKFEDKYFGYVAAFGAFTEISFSTPQNEKNTWGYLAYLIQALGSIPNIESYNTHVVFDGGELDGDIIFGAVVNSKSVGGIVKFPDDDVAINDGIFEVLLISKPNNAADLNAGISAILRRDFNAKNVHLLHTSHVRFEFDKEVQWTRDGENGGKHQTADIQNCHKAIRLFI